MKTRLCIGVVSHPQDGRCIGGAFGWRFGKNIRDIGSVGFLAGDRGTGFADRSSTLDLGVASVGVEAVLGRGCANLSGLED